MPNAGKVPGPTWAQTLFGGAYILLSGILIGSVPLWTPQVSGLAATAMEGIGVVSSILGAAIIAYGLRMHGRGVDDAVTAEIGPDLPYRALGVVRKDDVPPTPQTK